MPAAAVRPSSSSARLWSSTRYLSARWGLGAAYTQQQPIHQAIGEMKMAVESVGRQSRPHGPSGLGVRAEQGPRRRPEKTLAELSTLANRQYVPSSTTALVYAGLGDKVQALDQLEQAYQEHDLRWSFSTSRRGSRACAVSLAVIRRMQLLRGQTVPLPASKLSSGTKGTGIEAAEW